MGRSMGRRPCAIVIGLLVLTLLYSAWVTVALYQANQAARLGAEGQRFRIVLFAFRDIHSAVQRWIQDGAVSLEEVKGVQATTSRMLSELNLLLAARRERGEPSMSVVEEARSLEASSRQGKRWLDLMASVARNLAGK